VLVSVDGNKNEGKMCRRGSDVDKIKRNEWLVEASVHAPASSGMSSCWGARDTSLGVPGFMHCQFSNPKFA
jgi:hypothetical protein